MSLTAEQRERVEKLQSLASKLLDASSQGKATDEVLAGVRSMLTMNASNLGVDGSSESFWLAGVTVAKMLLDFLEYVLQQEEKRSGNPMNTVLVAYKELNAAISAILVSSAAMVLDDLPPLITTDEAA